MKYIVYKTKPDNLFYTHGILLPDGYFRVFEMTRYNGKNVESLQNRGYVIEEETDGRKCGLYDEMTLMRMDEDSVIASLDPVMRVEARALPDDAPEVDPCATLGMPDAMFKRGFQPPQRQTTRDDVRMATQELQMRARARKRD